MHPLVHVQDLQRYKAHGLLIENTAHVPNATGTVSYVKKRSCVLGQGVSGYDLLGLTRGAALSVVAVSTRSNMSTKEGVVHRRVDPHGASSALQSIPNPLRLRDSATLWEPCCNHSLPPLPPSFTECQMDGAEKPGESQACWVASSQTGYNPQRSRVKRSAKVVL